VARESERVTKELRPIPETHVGWPSLTNHSKGRLAAVGFATMIMVMGFALHGSIVGRLIEGAVMVAAIVVIWLGGTHPATQPRDDEAPGAGSDHLFEPNGHDTQTT
jgi:hypothetical protein